MTVVFAALSQNLNINGRAKVQNLDSSWNIHFAHISDTANEVKNYEYATTTGTLDLSNNDTTVTVPHVTLKAPGDKVEYRFKVVNEGEITGYINELTNIGIGTITYGAGETLTAEQKTSFQNDIQVTLTYNDQSKTRLAYNDELEQNQEKELILTIQYIKRETEQVLPTSDVTFTNITASITYGQDRTSKSGNGANPSSPEVIEPSGQFTMSTMCPGCVFAQNSSSKYITDGLAMSETDKKINSVKYMVNSENIEAKPMEDGATTSGISEEYTLTPNEYTSSYSGYNDGEVFLGYILANDGTYRIKRAFACGIENGEAFCLEGYDASKYSNNVDILNHFFPSCNASSSSSSVYCNGSSLEGAGAGSDGYVPLNPRSGYSCIVHVDGYANFE